jgi:hypothetical protein
MDGEGTLTIRARNLPAGSQLPGSEGNREDYVLIELPTPAAACRQK